MAAPRKSKGRSGKKTSASALDLERDQLVEQQQLLNKKIAALSATLTQVAEPARQRSTPPLPPAGARKLPRKVVLRAERQEGRMQTVALLLTVLALLAWAAYKYL